MGVDKPVRRIAVVGTGVIGASWAAQFLACGLDVIATDPAPNAEENLRKYIESAWTALVRMGLSNTPVSQKLSFTCELQKALSEADFVQENGPERQDLKIKLFADIDAATPADSIIASSSSALAMSTIQSACEHPERCVIGHPFNPPHMIPLVEVVGGAKTSPEAVRCAIGFYRSIGKKPLHVRKEVIGHVANRLQAAIYREIVNLISLDVLDVEDADTAVCWGPGLRWAVMGPNLLFHLSGGQGGIEHFMDHLSGTLSSIWEDLGNFSDWPAGSKQRIIDGVAREVAGHKIEDLCQMRDEALVELLKLRVQEPAL